MKKSKITSRIVLLVITAFCFIMFSCVGFAQTNEEKVNSQLDKLDKKYDNMKLKDATEIPEGITPIEYDSIEDFEKDVIKHQEYVEEQKAKFAKAKMLSAKDKISSESISTQSLEDDSQVKGQWLDFPGVPPVKLNIYVKYTYYGNRFAECLKIKSWTTGLSFPFGYGWTEEDSDYDKIDGGRTLAVEVTGTLDFYVVVNGIGKILTYNHSQYEEFYL